MSPLVLWVARHAAVQRSPQFDLFPTPTHSCRQLSETVISHNTWIHHVARVLVKPLVNTSVTPNQITTLRLVTGLGAAAALAVGAEWWSKLACIVLVVSLVLDRADGELARMSGKTSEHGHKYDLLADGCSTVAVFVGLGLGLRESVLGLWAFPLGIVAGVAVAAIFWLVMQIEAHQGARAAELPGFAGFDPDDAILIVPIAIWLGWSVPLLMVAAAGAGGFCVFFYWLFLLRRKRNRTSVSNVHRQ